MYIARTITELKNHLAQAKNIGFVPTMGALHDGHISLIQESVNRNLHTVASIFVNPTQFNNAADFEKYPIDTEADLKKLETAGCDLVFLPTTAELYPSEKADQKYIHDFGKLETTIEGAYRPGHFKGVGQIVHILFECVNPKTAFFGEKDFQQLQVIKHLVKLIGADIEIVGMPTIRESDGLAMSSRNRRLSDENRAASVLLYKALTFAKANIQKMKPSQIKAEVQAIFSQDQWMDLEYFEILNPSDFELVEEINPTNAHAVIAAYAGDIRLIDNLKLV
jgi:pantoate--beta-alanine ligase